MTDLTQFKGRLGINLDKLHLECAEQPRLYADLGEVVSNLRLIAKKGKASLELKRAEVSQLVRTDPKAFGLDKVTEGAVDGAVTRHPEVIAMQEALIQAEADAEAASAILYAFDQRRALLKAEVDLWIGRYWGEVQMDTAGDIADAQRERLTELRRQKLSQPK